MDGTGKAGSMRSRLKADWNRTVDGLVCIPAGAAMGILPLAPHAGGWAVKRQHGQPVPVGQIVAAATRKGLTVAVDDNAGVVRFARPQTA